MNAANQCVRTGNNPVDLSLMLLGWVFCDSLEFGFVRLDSVKLFVVLFFIKYHVAGCFVSTSHYDARVLLNPITGGLSGGR